MDEIEFLIHIRKEMLENITKANDSNSNKSLNERLSDYLDDTEEVFHEIGDRIKQLVAKEVGR